ncbi:MAG: caspase family protein [Crocinitomicaceae bacterium]|nr:caspase family protein [Crocinitomicaceae bacterium]
MRNGVVFLFIIVASFVGAQEVQLTVQTGHASTINKVIFSPDDELLVTAGADRKIVIWDFLTGKQYGVFLGHNQAVTDVAFSKDGTKLYSVSRDSTLKIWDFTNELLLETVQFDYPLGALEILSDEKVIVSGEYVCFYHLGSKQKSRMEFVTPELFTALDLSDDGTLLSVGGEKERYMYLVDLKEEKLLKKFVASTKDVTFDEGKKLIYSTSNGRLVEYCIKSGKHRSASTDWMLNAINAVEANKEVVYASNDIGEVYLFNRKRKWKSLGKLKMNRGKIKDITLSNNGKYLASVGENKTVVIWDTEDNKVVKSLKGRVHQINDIAFSRDGAQIIVAYKNGTVRRSNLISNQTLVNSLRPKSDILSAFSGYTMQRIDKVGFDTIAFTSLFTVNSLVYEGSYDKIDKYKITWDTRNNLITMDKSKEGLEDITVYMKDLKTEIFHGEDYFLDESLLTDKNDSIGISAEVNGYSLVIRNSKSSQVIHEINTGHSDRVTSVAINPVYGYVATASWDGMIRFWDITSGDLLTVYGAFGNGQFVYLDKSGYYFASKNALDYIGFKLHGKLYSFEQFDLKYNRPDIVAKSLPYFNEDYITAYHGAYVKRLHKLGLEEKDIDITTNLPIFEWSKDVHEKKKKEYLHLTVRCHDENIELDRLHIRVNGVPEFGRFGKQINGNTYESSFNIVLNPGTNYVQAYVTNKNGVSSFKQSFEIESHQKKEKSEMYLIALGVSNYKQSQYNLKYARKDAEDVVSFFRFDKPIFNRLHVKKLVDEEVTLDNVEALKEFAKQATENDVLILFAAGHGVLDANLDYYFASNDMDFKKPQEKGIPYDLFEEILDVAKSRKKVMFLDACHSGEIDKDEVIQKVVTGEDEGEIIFRGSDRTVSNKYDINSFELSRSLFADMRLNNGSTVVSSAGGAEYAIEGDKWNNGVFTYCLLKGLKEGEADLNNDKVIMLSELQKFVQNEVIKISKGLQTPTSRVENLNNDFRLM